MGLFFYLSAFLFSTSHELANQKKWKIIHGKIQNWSFGSNIYESQFSNQHLLLQWKSLHTNQQHLACILIRGSYYTVYHFICAVHLIMQKHALFQQISDNIQLNYTISLPKIMPRSCQDFMQDLQDLARIWSKCKIFA